MITMAVEPETEMTHLFVAVFLSLLPQLDYRSPDQHVDGIVEIPELFGEFVCDRFVPEGVDVYSVPSIESRLLGMLEVLRPWYVSESSPCESVELVFRWEDTLALQPVRYMEHAYESVGLIVVEARGEWLRIQLASETGWIRDRRADGFHAYQDLVRENLAHLSAGWPGRLWMSPRSSRFIELPEAWRSHTADEATVEVVDGQIVDGELWFKIRLDSEYGCGSLEETLPTVEGWIPGFGTSGANSIWFYSRGC